MRDPHLNSFLVKTLAVLLSAGAIAGCGGGSGGGSDNTAITAAINGLVKHHDCSKLTPDQRKQLTGEAGIPRCSHLLSLRNQVHQLAIDDISVKGSSADAHVTTDGQHVTLHLIRQGSQWLISQIGT